jgi:hypothetical protein
METQLPIDVQHVLHKLLSIRQRNIRMLPVSAETVKFFVGAVGWTVGSEVDIPG